jgi:hypothetical protein
VAGTWIAKRYLPVFLIYIDRFSEGAYALWNAGLEGSSNDHCWFKL